MLRPILHISFLGRKLNSFHFFGVLGYIIGLVTGCILAHQIGWEVPIVLLLGLIGAITFFFLTILVKVILGRENIVYYHHEIAILLFAALILFLIGKPVLPYLDILILGIGIFLGCGRMGCFNVGCCHGHPYKHGVKYGHSHVKAGFTWFYKDVPLLPVQLIESAYVFVIVISGSIILLKGAAPGTVLLVYTAVYGLMRFILEYFRGDPDRPLWKGLSEAQWTTLAITGLTYGAGNLGWFPLYNWHLAALVIMILLSIITIYKNSFFPGHILFRPAHLRQIAECLNSLANNFPQTNRPKSVNVYTTKAGVSISGGTIDSNLKIDHYTVSLKFSTSKNHRLILWIVQLISSLKNYQSSYELVETGKGIYHIIFRHSFNKDLKT